MKMARNTPEQARHLADGRRLEQKGREAEERGDMDRAKELYHRADLCFDLVEADRREEARRAAARVSEMDTPPIMTGHEGESVLDD